MEPQRVQFCETELKQVIFTALLASRAEREGPERDSEIIESFAESYWRVEYGEYRQFQKRVFYEINELLADEVTLYETIDDLLYDFGTGFNQNQKSIILGLFGYLFAGDGRAEIENSNLFTTFIQRLGTKQPEIEKPLPGDVNLL